MPLSSALLASKRILRGSNLRKQLESVSGRELPALAAFADYFLVHPRTNAWERFFPFYQLSPTKWHGRCTSSIGRDSLTCQRFGYRAVNDHATPTYFRGRKQARAP